MRSPSADPTPQSFRANLKELSATDHNLQNENFKLKLQIYHMRGRLKKVRADNDRRESYATPKIDNFYEDEIEDRYSEDTRELVDEVEFETDDQVIKVLQDKLDEKDCAILNFEEENKSLWDARDEMKANMKNQALAIEKLKVVHASCQAKVEGSRLQVDAAVAAMEEAQNDAQEVRKRLAEVSIKVKHEKVRADKFTQAFEKEEKLLEAAENCLKGQRAETDSCRRKIEFISKERDDAKHSLRAEVERREIWEATRNITEQRGGSFEDDSHQMEMLLTNLDKKRMRFERETEYDKSWRDSVNEYLKECMKALYTLEVQVDAKRRVFVSNKSPFRVEHPATVLA